MSNKFDTEVDRRFDIAYCYRLLLQQPLFDEGLSASEIVEEEIRAFVRQRLEVLMGVTSDLNEVAFTTFSQEEIVALKALAGKILGNQGGEEKKTKTKSSETQQQVTAPRHNIHPANKKKKTTLEGKGAQSVVANNLNKKKSTDSPKKENNLELGELASDQKTYYEGQIIEENGQKFKIKIQEIEGNKYVLKQNITGQVGSPNRIAMPSSYQLEQISRQQAIDSLKNLDPLAATAVQLTQTE